METQRSRRRWSNVRFLARWVPVLVLVAVAPVASGYVAQATTATNGHQLAGYWEVHVAPDEDSGIPPFVNVSTVSQDGTIVNLTPAGGVGVGRTERMQGHTYAVTFTGFVSDDPQRFTVHGTIQLEGDSFTGPFRTEITDADGNLVFAFHGTVHATRQPVEPF